MKRLLLGVHLVFILSAVGAVPLSFSADSALDSSYAEAIEEHLHRGLSNRLPAEMAVAADLTATRLLRVSTTEGAWELLLPETVERAAQTIDEALYWDIEALLPLLAGPLLSLPLREGFVLTGETQPKSGAHYQVLDANERVLGTIVATTVDKASGTIIAAQRSGDTLVPQLRAERIQPIEVGLYGSVSLSGALSAEAVLHYPLPLYPYTLLTSISGGSNGVGVSLGIGASVLGSTLFGTERAVGRNLSFVGWALVGMGYSQGLALRTDGRIGATYRIKDWAITVLVGNQITSSATAIVQRGVFFTLGTAYTIK